MSPIMRVLLVEADPRQASVLSNQLTRDAETFVVDQAEGIDAALQTVAQQRYDCAVLDLAIGTGDPAQMVTALQRTDGRLAVVVVSGPAEDVVTIDALCAGADGHLTKGHLEGAVVRRAVRFAVARKRVESDLVHRALYDPVTGLMNRLALDELLPASLTRADRRGTRIGAIFVDISGLDDLDAERGDQAVDQAVVRVADRLQEVARDSDLIARIGAGQFVVICEDLSVDRSVRRLATRIEESLAAPVDLSTGAPVTLPARLRFASADGATTPADLLRRSDRAAPEDQTWFRR